MQRNIERNVQQRSPKKPSDCRNLYVDYKSTCSPVEDRMLNPCHLPTLSQLTLDELEQYIQDNIRDRQTILTCREKRINHTNQCYNGVMDTGHQIKLRILAEQNTACLRNTEKALDEYRRRLILIVMNLARTSDAKNAIDILTDTLYLKGMINGNEQIPQDLSFTQIQQILSLLREQGSKWLIQLQK